MGNDFKQLDNLQRKILDYNQVLSNGKSVIRLIEKYQNKFVKLEKQLGSEEGSLRAIERDSRIIVEQLKLDQSSSAKLLKEITNISDQAKLLLASKVKLDAEIDTFSGNLETTKTDLDLKKQESARLLSEIAKLSESAKSKLGEIETKFSQVSSLEKQYADALIKLNDPENGIEANTVISKELRDQLSTIKDEGSKLLTDVKLYRDNVLTSKNNVESAEKEILSSKGKIEKYLSESIENRTQISDILSIVSDSSLATAFHERKLELNKAISFWRWVLIICIILVSVPLFHNYLLTSTIPTVADWWVIFMRFLFSSPLALLAFFASRQYTSERLFQEKYAFKETTSRVYKSHVLFLMEKFVGRKDDIFNFAKLSVENILAVPFDNKQTRIKFGLGSPFFGKFLNITGEVEDIANEFLDKDIIKRLLLNGSPQTQEKTKTTVKTTIDEK